MDAGDVTVASDGGLAKQTRDQDIRREGSWWVHLVIIAVTAWALALLLSFPSLYDFEPERIDYMRSGRYLPLCENPLERASLRDPMLAYRILPPTVTYLLGLKHWGALGLPYLVSIITLVVTGYAVCLRLGRRFAIYAVFLTALSFAITWPNCMLGYGDPFAHLASACLLITRRPWLVALTVLAGLLSDERFLMVWPLAALWHWQRGANSWGWLRRCWVHVVAAVLAWLVVRHALAVGWIGEGIPRVQLYTDMWSQLTSLKPWDSTWPIWTLNVLAAFEWTWLLIGLGVVCQFAHGHKTPALIFAALLAGIILSTVVVADVTRSVAFAFVAIPVSLAWLSTAFSTGRAAHALSYVGLLCALTPNFIVLAGYQVIIFRPLPLRMMAYFTGEDPLAGFF